MAIIQIKRRLVIFSYLLFYLSGGVSSAALRVHQVRQEHQKESQRLRQPEQVTLQNSIMSLQWYHSSANAENTV
jgi:hypothetical protein